jgi:hypothetical protein
MAGFASASLRASNNNSSNSATTVGGGSLTSGNVLNGDVVLLVVHTRVASGSPSVVSGTPTLSGVSATTAVQLFGFSDTLHNVEVWYATANANATSSVSWSGSLSLTASRREAAIQSWSGFPTTFSVAASATNATTTNATSWSCGAVDGVADDLLYGAAILDGTDGTVTQNANASGSQEHGGSSNISWRLLTGTVTAYDATYSGTNSRIVGAAMHLVLRESGGDTTLDGSLSATGTVTGALTTSITAAGSLSALATVTADLQALKVARPSSTSVAGSWTAVGAATLHAATNDSSDTTYIQSSAGATTDTCLLGFPAMGTPEAGPITVSLRYRS